MSTFNQRLPRLSIAFAVYGVRDGHGDIFAPGSLKGAVRSANMEWCPLLVNHFESPAFCLSDDAYLLTEDDRGASALFELRDSRISRLVLSAMRTGATLGASFHPVGSQRDGELITHVETLTEVSICIAGWRASNPQTSVKLAEPIEHFDLGLPEANAVKKLNYLCRFPNMVENGSDETVEKIIAAGARNGYSD